MPLFLPPSDKAAAARTVRLWLPPEKTPKEYTVARVEELLAFRYLPRLAFSSPSCYKAVRALYAAAVKKKTLDVDAEWLGLRFRNELSAGAIADVYIRWVDERCGYGLFANSRLEKGAFIGEYTGTVRHYFPLLGDANEYCFRYPQRPNRFTAYTIDASISGNEIRFMNQCTRSPNCTAASAAHNDLMHICLIANRAIEAGEQLTYNYGH